MAQHEVKLPHLGQDIDKVTVSFWHHEEKDKINENDDLVEVVSEKATFTVTSDASGRLTKILIQEGDEIKINEVIAVIETE